MSEAHEQETPLEAYLRVSTAESGVPMRVEDEAVLRDVAAHVIRERAL